MNDQTFGSVLDKAPSEVERPKALPVGSYRTVVKGLPRFDRSSKKGTEFAEYTLVLQEAMNDVDEEALERVLTKPSGEKVPLNAKTMRATYYLTDDAIWRLKDFLVHCGLDMDDYESLREACQQNNNCQVGIYIRHRASEDGSGVFAEIGKTFPIE